MSFATTKYRMTDIICNTSVDIFTHVKKNISLKSEFVKECSTVGVLSVRGVDNIDQRSYNRTNK